MSKSKEPPARMEYRTRCKAYGQCGHCYNRSILTPYCHISFYCDGCCKRMKQWDKAMGYQGVEFEIKDFS